MGYETRFMFDDFDAWMTLAGVNNALNNAELIIQFIFHVNFAKNAPLHAMHEPYMDTTQQLRIYASLIGT